LKAVRLIKSETQEKSDALVNEEQKAHMFLYTPSKRRVNKIVFKLIEGKLEAGPLES
jgi:hypothetical protein